MSVSGERHRFAGSSLRIKPAHMALHAALLCISAVMLAPFAWMVISSLKSEVEMVAIPPVLIPAKPNWDIYSQVLFREEAPFMRMFLNSVIVALGITAGQLITGSMAAFSFARLRFPGRDVLFAAVLATMMIPEQAIVIPLFFVAKELGLINTYQGLILPFVVKAFSIFLLRQAFMQVPRELEDAAEIDGLTIPGIFWRIVLPLSKPALVAMISLVTVQGWNQFLWPLVVAQKNEMRTVMVGIALFLGNPHSGYTWTKVMAASTIAVVPVALVFIVGQRFFTEGIAITGLKG